MFTENSNRILEHACAIMGIAPVIVKNSSLLNAAINSQTILVVVSQPDYYCGYIEKLDTKRIRVPIHVDTNIGTMVTSAFKLFEINGVSSFNCKMEGGCVLLFKSSEQLINTWGTRMTETLSNFRPFGCDYANTRQAMIDIWTYLNKKGLSGITQDYNDLYEQIGTYQRQVGKDNRYNFVSMVCFVAYPQAYRLLPFINSISLPATIQCIYKDKKCIGIRMEFYPVQRSKHLNLKDAVDYEIKKADALVNKFDTEYPEIALLSAVMEAKDRNMAYAQFASSTSIIDNKDNKETLPKVAQKKKSRGE